MCKVLIQAQIEVPQLSLLLPHAFLIFSFSHNEDKSESQLSKWNVPEPKFQ